MGNALLLKTIALLPSFFRFWGSMRWNKENEKVALLRIKTEKRRRNKRRSPLTSHGCCVQFRVSERLNDRTIDARERLVSCHTRCHKLKNSKSFDRPSESLKPGKVSTVTAVPTIFGDSGIASPRKPSRKDGLLARSQQISSFSSTVKTLDQHDDESRKTISIFWVRVRGKKKRKRKKKKKKNHRQSR